MIYLGLLPINGDERILPIVFVPRHLPLLCAVTAPSCRLSSCPPQRFAMRFLSTLFLPQQLRNLVSVYFWRYCLPLFSAYVYTMSSEAWKKFTEIVKIKTQKRFLWAGDVVKETHRPWLIHWTNESELFCLQRHITTYSWSWMPPSFTPTGPP